MSHPLSRGGGRSRDDLSPPARHCTHRRPASPSRVEGVPTGSATDYLHQPSTCPLPPPTQGLMAGQPGQVGPAQQCQLLTRHTASPSTGIEGRSAGVEERQQQPSHHAASIASPPCLGPRLPASSCSGADGGSIRTASPAADFLALYDRCMANGLKACLTFNHQAAHQEIVISCCLPPTSSTTNTDCRRRCHRRRRRRRRQAASPSLVMLVPAPSSGQESQPSLSPHPVPPLFQHHRRSPHQKLPLRRPRGQESVVVSWSC
jgi:hypothetical protein